MPCAAEAGGKGVVQYDVVSHDGKTILLILGRKS